MIILLAVSQWLQYLSAQHPANISMWWPAYLLAFPFPAATRDCGQKGLRLMGATAVAVSVVSVLYSLMLILNILPDFMESAVFWTGEARLRTIEHPNVTGWVFMLGVAFSAGFFFRTKNKTYRILLVVAIALQLLMQGLTNGRTSTLMTCAIIGGTVFFCIWNGGWKRFLLGLIAAFIVVFALFSLADFVYDKNHDKLAAKSIAEQIEQAAQATEEGAVSKQEKVPSEPPKSATATRNSFLQDLKSLTGRSVIWGDAFRSLREHPQYLLWGTADIPAALPTWQNPHAHNAWIQMLLGFGIPALLLSLIFTFLAARGALVVLFSRKTDMCQKVVAMLVGAMLVAGIMEPFLFTAYYANHFFTVVFMLCIGYLEEWRLQLKYGE